MTHLDVTIGHHETGLIIQGRTEITEAVTSHITMPAGATLILGVRATSRAVTVEFLGRADIHGTIHGDVHVQAGGWG